MSSMAGLAGAALNSSGGGQGTTVKGANLINPATKEQADEQYKQAQAGITQQQDFVNALAHQQGVQNQANVFNQYQGLAAGQGPNPAQAMLNQATGANVANQAALAASQRGSGANAGLMARQAAMQGANAQQQAVGQGANMQAQQQLAALGQMGNIAGQQVGQQQQGLNSLNQYSQGEQQQILGAINNQNQNAIANQKMLNDAAMQAQNKSGNLMSSLMGAAGTVFGGPLGGMVGNALGGALSGGGGSSAPAAGPSPMDVNGMQSAQASGASPMDMNGIQAQFKADGGSIQPGPRSRVGQYFANGGKVPVMLSPGEKVLSPEQAKAVAQGQGNPMAMGKTVPGKPVVKGAKNDYANDIIPDELEPGSVVVPRSKTQAKDADRKSAEFVQATLAKKRHGKKKAK